ncbi:DUF5431 family protein [Cronobacter sakazakii]
MLEQHQDSLLPAVRQGEEGHVTPSCNVPFEPF